MYFFRHTVEADAAVPIRVDLAFTDRHGGVSLAPYDELNLALVSDDTQVARDRNHALLIADFAPDAELVDMSQVHGGTAVLVREVPDRRPSCDGLVTAEPDLVLMARAADCVPVLLADVDAGVVAAVHSGRPGVLAGVVPAAVARMREQGAGRIQAWIGPHVCGACYEVPEAMQAEVGAVVPATVCTTRWGTPGLDIGAGVRAQLAELEVQVHDVSACTRETPDLYSHRRDGAGSGRLAGVIRMSRPQAAEDLR